MFNSEIENLINECVGRIVKGINTTVDVGIDQIKKEAAKFGFDVDKDGFPKDTFKKYIKNLKEDVDYNDVFHPFGEDIELSSELHERIFDNKYTSFRKEEDKIIFDGNRVLVITSPSKITNELRVYARFCSDNPYTTAEVSKILDDKVIDTSEDKSINISWYLYDKYEDNSDVNLANDIIDAYNKEGSPSKEAEDFVASINFKNVPMDYFSLDVNSFKRRVIDGELIIVDCFKGISSIKNKTASYKKALGGKFDYPQDLINFLEDNNFKKKGEGVFSSVYADDSHKVVIKINKGKIDDSYIKFANFCRKENSPHLPKLGKIRKFGDYYVLAMEKLETSNSSDFNEMCDWIDEAARAVSTNLRGKQSVLDAEVPEVYKSQKEDIIKVIRDMKSLLDSDIDFDLHSGNIMLRGNTIVLIDPIASVKEIIKATS